jgi:hypothetical protein
MKKNLTECSSGMIHFCPPGIRKTIMESRREKISMDNKFSSAKTLNSCGELLFSLARKTGTDPSNWNPRRTIKRLRPAMINV